MKQKRVVRKKRVSSDVLPSMVTRSSTRARFTVPNEPTPRHKKNKSYTCAGCFSAPQKTFLCRCQHRYCRRCLKNLFETAISDRNLLPVKCCDIKLNQNWCRIVLSKCASVKFEKSLEEKEALRKMYCPQKNCSAFINLGNADRSTRMTQCPECKTSICIKCSASHTGITCKQFRSLPKEDRSLEDIQFFSLAKENYYTRCAKCKRYIEHAGGCNHMICLCGHTFSYQPYENHTLL